MTGGFLIGIPANMLMAHFASFQGDYFQPKDQWLVPNRNFMPWVWCRWHQHTHVRWRWHFQTNFCNRILRLVQPMGKMAFSNYRDAKPDCHHIAFYGVGFAKGGLLGPTAWTIFGITVFFFQLFSSTLWLQYFNYGSVEWLWRSMTYRKWQAFRKIKCKVPRTGTSDFLLRNQTNRPVRLYQCKTIPSTHFMKLNKLNPRKNM